MLVDSAVQESSLLVVQPSEEEQPQIEDLIAERDALRIRLENAIDVRDNLAQWTEKAESEIISLKSKLAEASSTLPSRETMRRLTETAQALSEPEQQLVRDIEQCVTRLRELLAD
jgi:hypothetical protein